jgi:GxxExxY protein
MQRAWEPQMNTDEHGCLDTTITRKIIGSAHTVSNTLDCGFLEKVCENALVIELRRNDLHVEQQREIQVRYRDEIVGIYIADLLVEGSVLVELKATFGVDRVHRAQCLNYLRATGHRICLLLNFGLPRLDIERFAL